MALTHVHTPIRLGGVEVKNRVVRSAHGTNLGGGVMGDDLIAYHLARAKGGVGLTMIEILSVHPSSPSTINAWLPGVEDGYHKLVDAVRPHGMKLFQQIWHAGHNSLPLDGSPPWSASDIPSVMYGVAPIPMTQAMIDEIIAAYADTARRCEKWGLDGIELHGCHGYLPAQFLSPNANKREDAYGGTFENRARFTLEVMTAVRAAVSKSFAVGIRVADDATAGGVDNADYLRLSQMLEARGLVDFINVSMGNYQSFSKMIGGMHEPAGYELETSTPITHGVKTPTIVVGRFRTLEEADQVIRSGDADMVAMTRAHIADPDLVRKTLAGFPEQVRPCIACNQGCLGNVMGQAQRMECVVNSAVGYERSIGDDHLAPAAAPKKVFVIGGGPSGMEAARVAALRGHKVVLVEAEPSLGGTLKLAAKAPSRRGILDITTWLEQEVYRLGVEVRLSSFMDADEIRAENPDSVIVATGASPRMDGIQLSNPGEPIEGMDHHKVVSSNDLLTDTGRKLGSTAVVIDDTGHFEAIAVAEYLVSKGIAVTFITRHSAFGTLMETTQQVEPALQRLSRGNFTALTRTRAIAVDDEGVVIGPTYLAKGSNQFTKVPADTVVFVSINRPNREVFNDLTTHGVAARIIGDANSPRYLQKAIREGHLAGATV